MVFAWDKSASLKFTKQASPGHPEIDSPNCPAAGTIKAGLHHGKKLAKLYRAIGQNLLMGDGAGKLGGVRSRQLRTAGAEGTA